MDYDYRRTEKEYRKAHNIPEETKLNRKTLADFPIEHARQRNVWWIVLIFIVATALYGFSLAFNIAFPLILQFFIAYTATAVFSMNSALIIDLYPGASASATAVNNLMRCSVGAVGVATVQLMIDDITAKFTFLALAMLTAGFSPLLVVESKWGPGWRQVRNERLKQEANRKKEIELEKGIRVEAETGK
jgi:hypothetical protein